MLTQTDEVEHYVRNWCKVSALSLALCVLHTHCLVREDTRSVWFPCSWLRARMSALVGGSRMNATRVSGGQPSALCNTGKAVSLSCQLVMTVAWVAARALQAPDRRCRVSPGN